MRIRFASVLRLFARAVIRRADHLDPAGAPCWELEPVRDSTTGTSGRNYRLKLLH
jgi:hypothetical protein